MKYGTQSVGNLVRHPVIPLVILAGVATGLIIRDGKTNEHDSATASSAIATEGLVSNGEMTQSGNLGAMILPREVALGIGCKLGDQPSSSVETLDTTPRFDEARRQSVASVEAKGPTVFVGPKEPLDSRGEYAMKTGWALRFNEPGDYSLFHFSVGPGNTQRSVAGKPYLIGGEMTGQQVAKFSLAGLIAIGHVSRTDNKTNITVSPIDADERGNPGAIEMSIRCTGNSSPWLFG